MVIVLADVRWREPLAGSPRGIWCRRVRLRQLGLLRVLVNSGRVTEAALGYTINPLVSVLLGVVIFRERLTRPQWFAVALAVVAVGVLTIGYGHFPSLSVILAMSFGLYGVFKKKLRVDPVIGMTGEVAVIAPFALILLVWLGVTGAARSPGTAPDTRCRSSRPAWSRLCRCCCCGGGAAIPLATVGTQYIVPVLQMAWGLVVVGTSRRRPVARFRAHLGRGHRVHTGRQVSHAGRCR